MHKETKNVLKGRIMKFETTLQQCKDSIAELTSEIESFQCMKTHTENVIKKIKEDMEVK